MKKKLIGSIFAVVILSAGLLVFSLLANNTASTDAIHAQQASSSAEAEEMQSQIEELRALINLLLGNIGRENPSPASNTPSISSQRAREIAVELVGHGAAQNVMLFTEDGVLTFEVDVRYQNTRYAVYIDAVTGNIIRMSSFSDEVQAAAQPAQALTPAPTPTPAQNPAPQGSSNISLPANITPRPAARAGGPANPPISAQRAAELARDHLVAIGVTSARFDYVYMDVERGIWVWSVEFDGPGRSYEFYVDVNTGAFVQAPSAPAAAVNVTPSPSPSPVNTPQATSNPSPSPVSSPQATGSSHNRNSRPTNPAISLDRAIEIGYAELARRGHSGTFRNHSGMDWERGQWVWEIEFRVPGGRLPLVEMYINVDTGNVVKFEWDD